MMFTEKVKTIQAIVTIAAVCVGGFWTYRLFIMERAHYPHANVEQKISHVALSKRTNLLRIGIELTNTGRSRLGLTKSIIRVQQLLPIPSCPKQGPCAVDEVNNALKETERRTDRFSWPLIAKREKSLKPSLDIEPGEKDFIDFEFVVPSEIKVIRVYSYFRNDQRSKGGNEFGWTVSSYYELGKSKEESQQRRR